MNTMLKEILRSSMESIEQEVEVSAMFELDPEILDRLMSDTHRGDFHYQAEVKTDWFRIRIRRITTALNESSQELTVKIPNPEGGDTEITHPITQDEFEVYRKVFPRHLFKQRRYLFVKAEDGTQLRWEIDLMYDISKSRSNPEPTRFVKVDLELGDYRGVLPKFPYSGKKLEKHEARVVMDNLGFTNALPSSE